MVPHTWWMLNKSSCPMAVVYMFGTQALRTVSLIHMCRSHIDLHTMLSLLLIPCGNMLCLLRSPSDAGNEPTLGIQSSSHRSTAVTQVHQVIVGNLWGCDLYNSCRRGPALYLSMCQASQGYTKEEYQWVSSMEKVEAKIVGVRLTVFKSHSASFWLCDLEHTMWPL